MPFGGRDTCELYKSIDVRRWHREGRLHAGQQFPWSWTSGREPSGNINVRAEVDAVVLIYRVRSFLAGACSCCSRHLRQGGLSLTSAS